jgi:hypothetical protein
MSSSGLGREKVNTSPMDDSAAKTVPELVSLWIIGRSVDCGGRNGTSERIFGVVKLQQGVSGLRIAAARECYSPDLEIRVVMEADDLVRVDEAYHCVVLYPSARFGLCWIHGKVRTERATSMTGCVSAVTFLGSTCTGFAALS